MEKHACSPLGPSLEEKLFSSCDLTAGKTAHVNFKPRQTLTEMSPRARVSTQFQSSRKARNWATASGDVSLESVFVTERLAKASALKPAVASTAAKPSPPNSGERRPFLTGPLCSFFCH